MEPPVSSKPQGLFRQEAWEHLNAAKQSEGEPLSVVPNGLDVAYWLVVVLGVGLLLFAVVGRVSENATGSGIVRSHGRVVVAAPRAGLVSTVAVSVGDTVSAGQLLLTLSSGEEEASVARLSSERDATLLRYLTSPSDEGLRAGLTRLNAELQQAVARLEENRIRAPSAGVVTDMRVRPGVAVAVGDGMARLETGEKKYSLEAAVPGAYRPLLRAGLPVTVELNGYPDAVQKLELGAVAGEVVGPEEVQRALGRSAHGSFELQGANVMLQVNLPADLTSRGRRIELYDGMVATVHVAVGRERVAEAIFPWLKDLGK